MPAGTVGKRIYSHAARQRDCEFESHQGTSLNPNQMNKYERLKNVRQLACPEKIVQLAQNANVCPSDKPPAAA